MWIEGFLFVSQNMHLSKCAWKQSKRTISDLVLQVLKEMVHEYTTSFSSTTE